MPKQLTSFSKIPPLSDIDNKLFGPTVKLFLTSVSLGSQRGSSNKKPIRFLGGCGSGGGLSNSLI
jgi:hypothetical protein